MRSPGTVVVVSTDGHDDHDTGPGHPERPARLVAALGGIADVESARAATIERADPRPATSDELGRVHDLRYVDALERIAAEGAGHVDGDTVVSTGSFATALLAAGAGLHAVELLDGGAGSAAFVAVRPPGHHAVRTHGQGFCLFNNIAIVATTLADAGNRVLVLDWDVHHGNGTQDVFWDDPRVLFVSTHQSPLYPGTGRADETGGASAPGLTINVPLPRGATGDVALAALHEVAAPAVDRFAPDWVLVSAGFDAHRDDPLAGLEWSAGDYAALAATVRGFAPRDGRVVGFLEGGYDLAALRRSVAATVAGFAGITLDTEPPTSGGPGLDAVSRAARRRP